jgi:hypothetical protein
VPVEPATRERCVSCKEAVNDAIRAGLGASRGPGRSHTTLASTRSLLPQVRPAARRP